MSKIMDIIETFRQGSCACGVEHETSIRDIRIAPGLTAQTGEILRENGFPKTLLLVADRDTLRAAAGIEESLRDFTVERQIYDRLRVTTMEHVAALEERMKGRDIGVLAVGTGSVHDACRLSAARQEKPLCVFATAPSMDGFASYSAPIVDSGFKASYPAKSPEVILADSRILAAAPAALKSAGFGDMVAKYTALIDWQVSHLLTGEIYCERVAGLTRQAIDQLMDLADRVTQRDEETAERVFEALLLTGIGMSFTKNSRPASGAEHIISHIVECKELEEGKIPNYHGEDIGVCTLETLRHYEHLASYEAVTAQKEQVDWDDVYRYYGAMADNVRALNTPDTIADQVSPALLEEKWPEIRAIIRSVPSYETCRDAMRRAGCKLTVEDIGKDPKFFADCMRYSPYMRRRMTLLRLDGMIRQKT